MTDPAEVERLDDLRTDLYAEISTALGIDDTHDEWRDAKDDAVEAVMRVLAAVTAQARADGAREALEAAADELGGLVAAAVPEVPIEVKVSTWLRTRAAEVGKVPGAMSDEPGNR